MSVSYFCQLCLRETTGSPFLLRDVWKPLRRVPLPLHWPNPEEKTLASKTKKSDETEFCRICSTSGSLTLCGGACKLEQPLWKSVHCLVKLKVSISCDTGIPLWDTCPTEVVPVCARIHSLDVYRSVVHNYHKLKTTQMWSKVEWINKLWKRQSILPFTIVIIQQWKWVHIILSKINMKNKRTPIVWLHFDNVQNTKNIHTIPFWDAFGGGSININQGNYCQKSIQLTLEQPGGTRKSTYHI